MPLTGAKINSLKPKEKRIRCADGGGLYVDIMPSGAKIFRLADRSAGKQRTAVIGAYPDVRLSDARLKAAEFNKSPRKDVHPKTKEELESDPLNAVSRVDKPTWREIAMDYLMLRRRSGAAPRTVAKLNRQIKLTIATLGDRSIDQISTQDVLDAVNPIAEDGRVETELLPDL